MTYVGHVCDMAQHWSIYKPVPITVNCGFIVIIILTVNCEFIVIITLHGVYKLLTSARHYNYINQND